jgi:diguanylate cyclase (GGDEF)-like protein/PAS domain S-box-containing protein
MKLAAELPMKEGREPRLGCAVRRGIAAECCECGEARGFDDGPDRIALVSAEGNVLLWNHAAEAMTGFTGVDVILRPAPLGLEELFTKDAQAELSIGGRPGRWVLMRTRHKLGHEVMLIARHLVLRDGLGCRAGMAILFHPAERLDALPHGEISDLAKVIESQQVMEDRLERAFVDFANGGEPLGVLWIGVDQAENLCKTHGRGACEAMLDKVRQAMAQGLRPSEQMGRWGSGEFVVIAHERTAEMLSVHAQDLAGMARTADFRWWGDRVQLTVSIGASQAERSENETLASLLKRAQKAMESSIHAGGNTITPPPGGKTCLPL